MLDILASAIIVGHVQVGPSTCRVDFLVPVGAGEWELVSETSSCRVTSEFIRYINE
jgi:hypothetical protein